MSKGLQDSGYTEDRKDPGRLASDYHPRQMLSRHQDGVGMG